jgi:hypothetical protein
MDIFFLFKDFNLGKCGISDYIEILSLRLFKFKTTPIIITDKNINSKFLAKQSFKVKWRFFKIIKYFHSHQEKSIFFLQYSPFNYSRTGFSFLLIFLLFYLKFFKKKIKIVVNFHETRNRFSISPKYFLIYILHTVQFYITYCLAEQIYYTNDNFIKDLKILSSKKSTYIKIFPNICHANVKKKNNFIFFSSHFDFQKYKIFLDYIKSFQLANHKNFIIYFLGKCDMKVRHQINLLIKESNITNYIILNFSSKKKLSKILSSSKAIFVTNKDDFKINSSFLVSAINAKNFFFILNKTNSCSIIRGKYFLVNNQNKFNKYFQLILKSKRNMFSWKKKRILDFLNPDFTAKIFLKNFKNLF